MFFSLAITALVSRSHAGAARRVRRRARAIRAELRRLGGAVPRELRPHAAARRGRVRAHRRRAHRSRRSLRPRDRGRARAGVRQHRGVRRRARGDASGSRDGKPDFAGSISTRRCTPTRSWGAHGKVADLVAKHGLERAARSATVSVTVELYDARPGARNAATRSISPRCSRRARRSPARSCSSGCSRSSWTSSARTPARSPSCWCSSPNGEFLVQGAKTAAGSARVLDGRAVARSRSRCSKGIVNYVMRTSEHVVLDDAAQRGKFRNDPYVLNRHPKSVLCAPVAHKGKLIGVVYLENNQVAGAFTPDRLEALNILMSQIAVSIENATLYSKQEQQTPSDRSGQRHADEGDRRAQARGAASSAATRTTSRSSSRSARASSRTRRGASSTCRDARAWPRSRPACCTTSAT